MPDNNLEKVIVIIPTLNAGKQILKVLNPLISSEFKVNIFVVDSSSDDQTTKILDALNIPFIVIPRDDFNHGSTRQLAIDRFPEYQFAIFLTQDAIPISASIINEILLPFNDAMVGSVCGRQIPHIDSSPIAAHARLFNYPVQSVVRSLADVSRMGLKAAFMSNSFAAYRVTALQEVGGFPSDVIFGEDMVVAAKMLLKGWKIAYKAEAAVYHSHNYSLLQEFRRYFDIGVLHSREAWLLDRFGKPEGEGKKYVKSELRYMSKEAPLFIPQAIIRTFVKYLGYRIGKSEAFIASDLKRKISMNHTYWK